MFAVTYLGHFFTVEPGNRLDDLLGFLSLVMGSIESC